jgi:hypothetical protein
VLCAVLAYVLFPVRVVIEGKGTVEPVFEELVSITSDKPGVIVRVHVSAGQTVERGTPIYDYLPSPPWSIGTSSLYATTQLKPAPGMALGPDWEWARAIHQRSYERAEARRRWSSRVSAAGQQPQEWERRLVKRLAIRVPGEDDLELAAAAVVENARRGTPGDQLVHLQDPRASAAPPPPGGPFSSDVAGAVYSLWVRPLLTLWDPIQVAEVMSRETPLEVFGLLPVSPPGLPELRWWLASLAMAGGDPDIPLSIQTIEFGRVPIEARDAKALFPKLAVTRDSVFVRVLLLNDAAREKLGAPVRVTLTSPPRPRIWLWLSGV